MKLLVLILGCKANPYPRLIQCVKSTWGLLNVPNTKIYTYYGSTQLSQQKLIGDEIHLVTGDNNILGKTLEAYEFALRNFEFDYILRTSPSTFVRLDKLYEHLLDKNRTNYYAGHKLNIKLNYSQEHFFYTKEVIYPSGIAMIFSRDLLQHIVENKKYIDDRGFGDDFHIGLYLQRKEIFMTENIPHLLFTNYDINILKNTPKEELEKYMFFRCKTEMKDYLPVIAKTQPEFRNDDEKMNYLFELFYKEQYPIYFTKNEVSRINTG